MTIRVRLTIWYALIGTVTLLIVGAVVWFQYGAALRRSVDEVIEAQASATADLLRADPTARPDAATLERGLFVVVYSARDTTTYASPDAPILARPPLGFSTLRTRTAPDTALFATATRGGKLVVAGSSLAEIDRNLDRLAQTMALVGLAGVALSLAGGWLLAGRALAPVAELIRQADAIDDTQLDRRLADPGRRDELGALSRTLNRMLGRVEEAARRQRAFVVGVSHDLRTPLAALRAELELALTGPPDSLALRAAVEGAHGDAVRLSDLANGLLRLAAAEPDGAPVDREVVSLPVLISESLELARAAGVPSDVAIDVSADDGQVEVDRTRLEQAVVNLLTNAVRFAPAGTAVDVRAGVRSANGARILRVDVSDQGPGVADDLRSSLFQPFARSRTARSTGTGLGLATAAAAVHAHGGSIGYEQPSGGGARFWFWVPTA